MSDHPRPDDEPTLGRIVLYRPTASRAPRAFPAVIVQVADGVPAEEAVPAALAGRVHLMMLHPLGAIAAHDIGEDDHRSGFYVEDTQAHGTWRWPNFAAGRRARV